MLIKLRKSGETIDLSEIQSLYYVEQMSLAEIAEKYNCTRQNIYQILKRYGIKTRDKMSASTLAFEKGKHARWVVDVSGSKKTTLLEKVKINEAFFKKWSPEMAYVLGVLYTDGNLLPRRTYRGSKVPARVSLAQKSPELLEKVLSLMQCKNTLQTKEKIFWGDIFLSHRE